MEICEQATLLLFLAATSGTPHERALDPMVGVVTNLLYSLEQLVISDRDHGCVIVTNATGDELYGFDIKGCKGVCVSRNRHFAYVAAEKRVLRIDLRRRDIEDWWVTVESLGCQGRMTYVVDIAECPNGNLVLSEHSFSTLIVVSPEGKYIKTFGSDNCYDFKNNAGIETTPQGTLIVACYTNRTVVEMDQDGVVKRVVRVDDTPFGATLLDPDTVVITNYDHVKFGRADSLIDRSLPETMLANMKADATSRHCSLRVARFPQNTFAVIYGSHIFVVDLATETYREIKLALKGREKFSGYAIAAIAF